MPAIAPQHLTTPIYSAETIERGRLLAAAGDCFVCHTADGGVDGRAAGARGAGGRAMHTPFGTVYSTNLTPDAETGLGAWSFSAFQRAMREGVSRDGRHLYPAFPYTAFAKLSDDDLQALYAYLMSQPAVRAPTPGSLPSSSMTSTNAFGNKSDIAADYHLPILCYSLKIEN